MNQQALRLAIGAAAWLTADPPKDGTTIVAIGRVISRGVCSTSVDRFVAAIRWLKDQSGHEGWHFDREGSTVSRLDDEVIVDWWLPMPDSPTAGA